MILRGFAVLHLGSFEIILKTFEKKAVPSLAKNRYCYIFFSQLFKLFLLIRAKFSNETNPPYLGLKLNCKWL